MYFNILFNFMIDQPLETPKHYLSEAYIREVLNFIEYAPPRRLSKGIRNIFLIYLLEDIGQPNDFTDTVGDLLFLFEFLDASEKEAKLQGFAEVV